MSDDDYRSQIDRLIREASGEPILNGARTHAAIILERMFANAEKSVSVLTHTLDPAIFEQSEMIEEVRSFLLDRQNKRARILVAEFDDTYWEDYRFLDTVFGKPNFEMRWLSKDHLKIVDFNFAVMDNSGYRFQENWTQQASVTSFGSTEFADDLFRMFDHFWNDGVPVELVRQRNLAAM